MTDRGLPTAADANQAQLKSLADTRADLATAQADLATSRLRETDLEERLVKSAQRGLELERQAIEARAREGELRRALATAIELLEELQDQETADCEDALRYLRAALSSGRST